MPACAKTPRELRFQLNRAAFQLENFPTSLAVEVVVVIFARHLIPSRLAWQLDRGQPSLVHKRADVAIYRRDTDSVDFTLRHRERLFGGERTICVEKRRPDRVFLFRFACRRWHPYDLVSYMASVARPSGFGVSSPYRRLQVNRGSRRSNWREPVRSATTHGDPWPTVVWVPGRSEPGSLFRSCVRTRPARLSHSVPRTELPRGQAH